jgi:hypothetical protein
MLLQPFKLLCALAHRGDSPQLTLPHHIYWHMSHLPVMMLTSLPHQQIAARAKTHVTNVRTPSSGPSHLQAAPNCLHFTALFDWPNNRSPRALRRT